LWCSWYNKWCCFLVHYLYVQNESISPLLVRIKFFLAFISIVFQTLFCWVLQKYT
jgi:hypothetical protein